ncbi:FAD-binding domain containing protein [Hyaloscypha variabilis]
MQVSAKSGGHSWQASFLREGSLLLDMGKMNAVKIDVGKRTAVVQTAAHGVDLNNVLLPHGLMFPAGHCPSVGIGGFLLQGGFGWNSRAWGVACESVLAIDVVNAEGELIHADNKQNSDYYWAARGAGCGYFAIATHFYLELKPLPKGIMSSRYILPIKCLDELFLTLEQTAHKFPRSLEVGCFIGRDQDGFKEPTIAFYGHALAESEDEARYGFQLLDDLPVVKKAHHSTTFVPCTLADMLKRFDDLLDNAGLRYEANNFWTDAPMKHLLPNVHNIINNLPPAPSHLYLFCWYPDHKPSDMAFSMQSNVWMSLYAIGQDSSKDEANHKYVIDSIKAMDPYSKGTQLADENLFGHPARFMQPKNFERLEKMRNKHDPWGRFFGHPRIPPEFEEIKAKLNYQEGSKMKAARL